VANNTETKRTSPFNAAFVGYGAVKIACALEKDIIPGQKKVVQIDFPYATNAMINF
jgi:hypothetical protein